MELENDFAFLQSIVSLMLSRKKQMLSKGLSFGDLLWKSSKAK